MTGRMRLVPIVVSLAILTPVRALAWSADGHRIVCEIAFQRLSPEGRRLVADLQRDEPGKFHDACLWADTVKRTTRPDTYDLHFVNVPAGVEGVDMERDCPDGECVLGAIERFRRVLSDRSRSRHDRNEALKFLGHFVGDVHQPLHVGRPQDRGGNEIEVCFFRDCGNPRGALNLHLVWDMKILDREHRSWRRAARKLNGSITDAELHTWRTLDATAWADESYRLDEDFVYPRLPADAIDDEYYGAALQVVEMRLRQAGVRLALLIDGAARGDTGSATAGVPRDRPLRAGFLILDGVYNTELTAPYDIFHHTVFHADPGMEVFTVSPDGRPVRTFEGLEIAAHYGFDDAPPIDVLVVPSAEHNMDSDLENEELLTWLRATGEKALFVVSLCDGAFLLAAAGLLDGLACTTFPGDQDRFAGMFPDLDLRRGVSFVHDGKALTSQGGARSFDVAMYLAAHLYGDEAARGIGRGMVIPWPPAAGTVPALIVDRAP